MPSPVISPLTAHLGYWLRYVSNHVSRGFAQQVEARGVSVAEWVLLRELYDPPEGEGLAPSVLADRMGMTRGGVTKIADRLIAKSLISRAPDARDGRAQLLQLSNAGRALVPELAALADANDAAFFSPLAPPQRAELERLLRQLVQAHQLRTVPVD